MPCSHGIQYPVVQLRSNRLQGNRLCSGELVDCSLGVLAESQLKYTMQRAVRRVSAVASRAPRENVNVLETANDLSGVQDAVRGMFGQWSERQRRRWNYNR